MAFPKKYENATWKFMNRHFVSVNEVVNNDLVTNNLKILGIVLTVVNAFFRDEEHCHCGIDGI